MKSEKDKTMFVTCACESNEHLMRFTYMESVRDKDMPLEVFFSVHLKDSSKWYERFWTGIKYIFGYNSKFGHWDEVLLNQEKMNEIKTFFDAAEKSKKELDASK